MAITYLFYYFTLVIWLRDLYLFLYLFGIEQNPFLYCLGIVFRGSRIVYMLCVCVLARAQVFPVESPPPSRIGGIFSGHHPTGHHRRASPDEPKVPFTFLLFSTFNLSVILNSE